VHNLIVPNRYLILFILLMKVSGSELVEEPVEELVLAVTVEAPDLATSSSTRRCRACRAASACSGLTNMVRL
jgi:hypothetical protein